VDSARGFVRLWLLLALLILAYAWVDLRLNPRLLFETEFSMRPDLSQLPDLMHWGGRLLNHGALSLLIGNALVLAGLGALLGRTIVHFVQRLRRPSLDSRVSIVPAGAPTSVPPPRI
jgi:hypothetical protein